LFAHRSSTGPVDLAFTDRYDGVSAVPFDSLNLALVGDDDPAAVERNLALLLDEFAPGATLADMRQVHGRAVVEAGGPRADCDAIVTDRTDVVLMVRVADCVPVLLADPDAGVVGAAHAGRQGLVEGVVEACVARLRDLGARQVQAWVGPHICGACYEVPESLQREVAEREPASLSTTSWGTPGLDIGAGVRSQLQRAGVSVHDVSRCTLESADLYSYRRDGSAAGRLAGVIRLRP
jgi:purine-nucleoside/S-methyl-5'-thioadenosine phosphorylase / adenosine deaminase